MSRRIEAQNLERREPKGKIKAAGRTCLGAVKRGLFSAAISHRL
jgi:hypothetical protein